MGAFLLGFLPKFAADFLLGIFKDWRRTEELKKAGRTEEKLEQSKATVEVLARTNEAGNLVDQMSDAEVDEEFKKL